MAPSESSVKLPRQLNPGDLILTCKPWISSPDVATRGYVCAYCFQCHLERGFYQQNVHPVFIKVCSGCKAIGYCDEKCQKAHWKAEHKAECYFMRNIISSPFRELVFPDTSKHHGRKSQHCTRKLLVLKLLNKLLNNLPEPQDEPSLKARIDKFMKLEHCFPIEYVFGRDERFMHRPAEPGPLGNEGERWARQNYEPVVYTAFGPERKRDVQQIMTKYDVERMYQILRCQQKFVVYDLGEHCQILSAIAFYFEVAGAKFTCEANAFFSFNGRNLELRAVEPFTFSGSPKELKLEYDTVGKGHIIPRVYRTLMYTRFHGGPCGCKFCSVSFDDELLTLRCSNKRCDEPRPGDRRSFEPCPKCGAKLTRKRLTSARERMWLHYFKPYVDLQYGGQYDAYSLVEIYSRVVSGRDRLIHPTNFFVLHALGTFAFYGLGCSGPLFNLFVFLHMRPMIPVYRRMFPRHSNCLKYMLLSCGRSALRDGTLLTVAQKKECLPLLKEAMAINQIRYGFAGRDFDGMEELMAELGDEQQEQVI